MQDIMFRPPEISICETSGVSIYVLSLAAT